MGDAGNIMEPKDKYKKLIKKIGRDWNGQNKPHQGHLKNPCCNLNYSVLQALRAYTFDTAVLKCATTFFIYWYIDYQHVPLLCTGYTKDFKMEHHKRSGMIIHSTNAYMQ